LRDNSGSGVTDRTRLFFVFGEENRGRRCLKKEIAVKVFLVVSSSALPQDAVYWRSSQIKNPAAGSSMALELVAVCETRWRIRSMRLAVASYETVLDGTPTLVEVWRDHSTQDWLYSPTLPLAE
jgi:hypothetical protein